MKKLFLLFIFVLLVTSVSAKDWGGFITGNVVYGTGLNEVEYEGNEFTLHSNPSIKVYARGLDELRIIATNLQGNTYDFPYVEISSSGVFRYGEDNTEKLHFTESSSTGSDPNCFEGDFVIGLDDKFLVWSNRGENSYSHVFEFESINVEERVITFTDYAVGPKSFTYQILDNCGGTGVGDLIYGGNVYKFWVGPGNGGLIVVDLDGDGEATGANSKFVTKSGHVIDLGDDSLRGITSNEAIISISDIDVELSVTSYQGKVNIALRDTGIGGGAEVECFVDLRHCSNNEKAAAWRYATILTGWIDHRSYLDKSGDMCVIDEFSQSWPVMHEDSWWCGEVVFEEPKPNSECQDFPAKLETCSPYECEFVHLFNGEMMTRKITGFVNGKCHYEEEMPNDMEMICDFENDLRVLVAEYYSDTLWAEDISFSVRMSLDKTISTYTIDGVTKDNQLQTAMDNGQCVIGGYEIPESVCGNGILENGEECEGSIFLGSSSCEAYGFNEGKVACSDDCTIDTSVCFEVDPYHDLSEEIGIGDTFYLKSWEEEWKQECKFASLNLNEKIIDFDCDYGGKEFTYNENEDIDVGFFEFPMRGEIFRGAVYLDVQRLVIERGYLVDRMPYEVFCTEEYDPVCGTNGKTYSNRCFAEQSKVRVECEGECPCFLDGNCPLADCPALPEDCEYINDLTKDDRGCYKYPCGKVECEDGLPPEPIDPTKPVPVPEPTCNGCQDGDRCYDVGIRVKGTYCDLNGNFRQQKDKGDSCDNDFECDTNQCSSGECVDIQAELKEQRGLIEGIMDFLKKLKFW